jgi:hypothetical protein
MPPWGYLCIILVLVGDFRRIIGKRKRYGVLFHIVLVYVVLLYLVFPISTHYTPTPLLSHHQANYLHCSSHSQIILHLSIGWRRRHLASLVNGRFLRRSRDERVPRKIDALLFERPLQQKKIWAEFATLGLCCRSRLSGKDCRHTGCCRGQWRRRRCPWCTWVRLVNRNWYWHLCEGMYDAHPHLSWVDRRIEPAVAVNLELVLLLIERCLSGRHLWKWMDQAGFGCLVAG